MHRLRRWLVGPPGEEILTVGDWQVLAVVAAIAVLAAAVLTAI